MVAKILNRCLYLCTLEHTCVRHSILTHYGSMSIQINGVNYIVDTQYIKNQRNEIEVISVCSLPPLSSIFVFLLRSLVAFLHCFCMTKHCLHFILCLNYSDNICSFIFVVKKETIVTLSRHLIRTLIKNTNVTKIEAQLFF